MVRYRRETENDDGWSDWIRPLPGYKMACCDCGLVHNLEFRIDDNGNTNFRASRNERATAAKRRENKKRSPIQNEDKT